MPFLLVTGHPACGKSTIVDRLAEFFRDKGKEVLIVRDDDYAQFSRSHYNDSNKEKDQRSYIRSQVQRHLSKTTIVICDALNYIKGFRYELFLTGKLSKTTYAVLEITSDADTCKWLNGEKDEAVRYPCEKIDELLMRFERPDPKQRWDSPLFSIKTGRQEHLDPSADEDMSLDLSHPAPRCAPLPDHDIYKWLCEGVALTENAATAVVPLAPTNFLHDLDRTTQEVVSLVVEAQRSGSVGADGVLVSCAADDCNRVQVSGTRSLAELSRLRRQFISMRRTKPVDGKQAIATLFVDFLNMNCR